MEESVLLHRLESRTPGHRTQAIEELIGIVRSSGKLHFNNKLSLFSSFKRILQDEDLTLRTKCTKLIGDILPKLGTDMDTCMSFVMPNILGNMAANNLVLKRESIKLVKTFSEITLDTNTLIRCIIWEGIDSKDTSLSKEVILNIDKMILGVLQTEDSYNIIAAMCKRYYLEDNKKLRRAIRDSFTNVTQIIGHSKMEEIVTQLPTSALTAGKELLQLALQKDKPKLSSYKSASKLEVDSAISVEMKLLWDLIPDYTLTKLHGDDVSEQLKAIKELEEAIRKVTNPSNFLVCIDEICDAIIKVIPINNFRVFKASTALVSAFVEVFRDVMGDCVLPLTRVLCHKIGDNKIAVREGTMKCLTLLMKMCGAGSVLDVVLQSFRDRNPRVREEAVNMVIKALLTFPLQDLNVNLIIEYLVSTLADSRQRVATVGLEGIAVLSEHLPQQKIGLVYRAVENIDYPDRRFLMIVKTRLDRGTVSTLNDAGLVTHGEGCFSRNGSSMGASSRISISVPTTSHEHVLSKDGTICPPTPLSLPRRYFSAGRNRLPWERTTMIQGGEESFNRPSPDRNHVFIKGGGARTDGGSYAQMHLKKIQKEDDQQISPRSNTLGSLKKYFPSVKGSPDPKRSWPSMNNQDDDHDTLSNGSAPVKSSSFTNDTYGVQSSSMYQSYRVNSGESSGVGSLTNNTPNGSASVPPRHSHNSFSPSSTLNDSGIFEEHSFVNVKTPHNTTPKSCLRHSKTPRSHDATPRSHHATPRSHHATPRACVLQDANGSLYVSPRNYDILSTSTLSPHFTDMRQSRTSGLKPQRSRHNSHPITPQRSHHSCHGIKPQRSHHSGHGITPQRSHHSGHGITPRRSHHSGHGITPQRSHHSGHGITPQRSHHSGHGITPQRSHHSGHSIKPQRSHHSGHGITPQRSHHNSPRNLLSTLDWDMVMIRSKTVACKTPKLANRNTDIPHSTGSTPNSSHPKPYESAEDIFRRGNSEYEHQRLRSGRKSRTKSTRRRRKKSVTYISPETVIRQNVGCPLPPLDTTKLTRTSDDQRKSNVSKKNLVSKSRPNNSPDSDCTAVNIGSQTDFDAEVAQDDTRSFTTPKLPQIPGLKARRDKIRKEEQTKEDKRREYLEQQRSESQRQEQHRQQELADQERREEEIRKESQRIGNGYVELISQNLAKKKMKQAAEEARKPRAKLVKVRTRTESLTETPDIDVVGKGLSSGHVGDGPKESVKDQNKIKPAPDKTPLRAPSGVYGQRVQPSKSPDELDESLSDDDDEDSDSDRRDGHPVGSGLSAATRMRFEKKRAQYVERQSAEHRPFNNDEVPCCGVKNYEGNNTSVYDEPEPQVYASPDVRKEPSLDVRKDPSPLRAKHVTHRALYGKPVSAPVESRNLHNSDNATMKRAPSKVSARVNSVRPGDTSLSETPDIGLNSVLADEKCNVPFSNPDSALNDAVKNMKKGGEEWSYKMQALHVFRRIALHHPDIFQAELLTIVRLSCTEVPNLRSTVSRLAIQVIGDYFTHMKTVMDTDIDKTCECLLLKSAELNQFIRNDTLLTLSKMVEHATAFRVLYALIQGGASHKNVTVRAATAISFKDVVAKMGVNRCLTSKELTPRFLTALERFCHDGNQETRYYGKLVLSWCMEHPTLDSLCQKHLPAVGARNIRDMCEKLKAKGVGTMPPSSDRTSGRYRSQPVSRAQSNMSATYPGNRSRKASVPKDIPEITPSFVHTDSNNDHGLYL